MLCVSLACGLWIFPLLEVHCFSASALWACFWFERPFPALPPLCWLRLSLFCLFSFSFWLKVSDDMRFLAPFCFLELWPALDGMQFQLGQDLFTFTQWWVPRIKVVNFLFNLDVSIILDTWNSSIWFHASWSVQDAICDWASPAGLHACLLPILCYLSVTLINFLLADFIPVLPHVFPLNWSWYSALNLIARHAVTAAVETVTNFRTICRGLKPSSCCFFSCGADVTGALSQAKNSCCLLWIKKIMKKLFSGSFRYWRTRFCLTLDVQKTCNLTFVGFYVS